MSFNVPVDDACIQEPREVVKIHAVQETNKKGVEGTLSTYPKFNSTG